MKEKKRVNKIATEWIYSLLIGVGIIAFVLISPIAAIYLTSFFHIGGTFIDLIIIILVNIFLISIPSYYSIKNYLKKKNSPSRFILVMNCTVIVLMIFEWIFIAWLILRVG